MKKEYDHIVVGAGISGCSVAYELLQNNCNVLLIDKLNNIAAGASGAAGAFLSPLLGKPNLFKDLVTKALFYSVNFYKKNFPNVIDNCGTTRIPKNRIDSKKFKEYIPYMDFPFKEDDEGYFFNIGSVVNSFGICRMMTTSFSNTANKIDTKFNYEVKTIEYKNGFWYINDDIRCKKLILTTGASMELLDQFYLKIRAVWGIRIDIKTSTKLEHNYHKACSVSKSFKIDQNCYKVSIGATHHRDKNDVDKIDSNIEELISKAMDIASLKDVEITKQYVGARSCSIDYFPMVGKIIDAKKTLEEFPYLKNGTHVKSERFTRYDNLYILNGLGGRGFVLAPYLAKMLVDNIINNTPVDESVTIDRLFIREVKRLKDENNYNT